MSDVSLFSQMGCFELYSMLMKVSILLTVPVLLPTEGGREGGKEGGRDRREGEREREGGGGRERHADRQTDRQTDMLTLFDYMGCTFLPELTRSNILSNLDVTPSRK